jgi:hypothetical protein
MECDSMFYDLTISFSRYPSTTYGNVLKKSPIVKEAFTNEPNISDYDLQNSVTAFSVKYENFYYTKLVELEKTDWLSLVSSLGGVMGLFLGASVISLFEVVELFLQILIHTLKV